MKKSKGLEMHFFLHFEKHVYIQNILKSGTVECNTHKKTKNLLFQFLIPCCEENISFVTCLAQPFNNCQSDALICPCNYSHFFGHCRFIYCLSAVKQRN